MAASNGRVEKGVPTGLVPAGLAARVDAKFNGEPNLLGVIRSASGLPARSHG